MIGLVSDPIHFLVPGSISQPTGGYTYLRRLAEGLRLRGHLVTVHELSGPFPVSNQASLRRADIIISGIPDGARVLVDGLALPIAAASLFLDRFRLQVAALIHHPLHMETGLSVEEAERLRWLEQMGLAHIRQIIVNSPETAADLLAMGMSPARLSVVPPGTDPAPRSVGGSNPPNILCLATLTPRKGHLVLIEALAKLKGLPWQMSLVGDADRDPSHAAEVRAAIVGADLQDRVTIHGVLQPDALALLWQAIDLFVLPSLHEGYGMAAAEALARGIPVVASKVGGLGGLVPAGAGGLVTPGDPAGLADALAALLSSGDHRQAASAVAVAAGKKLPNWPLTVDRVLAAFSRMVPPMTLPGDGDTDQSYRSGDPRIERIV